MVLYGSISKEKTIFMWKKRLLALIILILGFGVGYFVYKSEAGIAGAENVPAKLQKFGFKLGLDLSGGVHLVYRADTSGVADGGVKDSMSALRDVIERRINIFGVSEPVIQVESGSFTNGGEERLIVDLPGVTDVDKAIAMIGKTPLLDFRVENPKLTDAQKSAVDANGQPLLTLDQFYTPTELSGRYLKRATLQFDPTTSEPVIGLQFDDQGSKLFETITGANVGKTVAIFLDGNVISAPVVREAISGGQAQISGSFTAVEARELVRNLNYGALPVPIDLISTQTIGATLGNQAIQSGIYAGLIGLLAIALFFVLWYRASGVVALVALSLYIAIMLALFKLIPVTLTAAGIAGFIISIGVAVDANVLIFERIKEELKTGKTVRDAIKAGFGHAWFSIRDSNTSSVLTAIILFMFGTTLIKGFALTLGLGVLVSLFSAIVVTRAFLFALSPRDNKITRFLFSSGISK